LHAGLVSYLAIFARRIMSRTFSVTTWPRAYHVIAKLCSAQVTPSITLTTPPRRAVPGDCHGSDVCRTVTIASPRLRAPFSQIAAVPFLLCTLKKQCDEASHLVNLQAADERTSFSLRGDTSTLRFCGYPSPRHEPVNVAEAANPKLDALDHSQAS
jgi:hypothetical protein